MIGIYKITSPSGRVYIGQSVNIENRWMHYRTPNNSLGQTRLNASFSKHGVTSHVFEVICECSIGELNALERSYQEQYDVLGPKGLNSRLVDEDGRSGYLTDDIKKKISDKLTGRKIPKEVIEKWMKNKKQYIRTDEIKDKARQKMKGRTFSEEHRKKLSEAKKGKPSWRKGLKFK